MPHPTLQVGSITIISLSDGVSPSQPNCHLAPRSAGRAYLGCSSRRRACPHELRLVPDPRGLAHLDAGLTPAPRARPEVGDGLVPELDRRSRRWARLTWTRSSGSHRPICTAITSAARRLTSTAPPVTRTPADRAAGGLDLLPAATGATAASAGGAPSFLRERPTGPRRIGVLDLGNNPAPTFEPFYDGLRDLGYEVGRDILIEYRDAQGDAARSRRLADELVGLRVEVIVARDSGAAVPAAEATQTIPIVVAGGNVIAYGMVKSITGPKATSRVSRLTASRRSASGSSCSRRRCQRSLAWRSSSIRERVQPGVASNAGAGRDGLASSAHAV